MKTRKPILKVLLAIALLIMVLNLSCLTLAAGGFHTVGIEPDGTVVAVGDNYYGQCDVDDWILEVESGPWKTYHLTISSTAGGLVTTPGEGTFEYDAVLVVSLVAISYSGYQFDNWTGDVETVADVGDAETTITMNGDYSITANFEGGYADASLPPQPTAPQWPRK